MRIRVLLFAVVLLLGAGIVAGGLIGSAAALDDSELVYECAVEPNEHFDDPEDGNETIGWFDGYWYDEPIDLDLDNGLTVEELQQLSARTAARLEAMRCLPFEELPGIEVIDRDTFADETAEGYASWSEESRLFDNQQFETLLTIGSDRDSVEVREESTTITTGGYYNFAEERIVIISDSPDSLMIDEAILAHELGHALQDQHFDLGQYNRSTKDLNNGKLGVIEGDVHRLEHAYMQRCEEERWADPCVISEEDPAQNGGDIPSWGQFYMSFQPYSDGPSFIDYIYQERDGWDGVDDLYEEMPRSTLHTIDPSSFGEVALPDLSVEDQSSHEWERIQWEDGPTYNVIGQAGMSAMFMGQSAESFGDGVIAAEEFENLDDTGFALDPFNPFNYDLDETSGWQGDRLYVYADQHDQTGSVWKTAWVNEIERQTFMSAYEALVEARGGERVPGYVHTWEFPNSNEYDMVVTLYEDSNRLWIVTAPTVEDLKSIHQDTEFVEEQQIADEPPWVFDDMVSPSPVENQNGNDVPENDDAFFDTALPGFGILSALTVLALLAYRYSRN